MSECEHEWTDHAYCVICGVSYDGGDNKLTDLRKDLAEAEALLREANVYLSWGRIYAWLERRSET